MVITNHEDTKHTERIYCLLRDLRASVVCARGQLLAGIALVILAAAPAAAHHSFAAEFDITKPVTITGKVTKIEWTNPHAYLFIDVADAQTGAVTNWEVE